MTKIKKKIKNKIAMRKAVKFLKGYFLYNDIMHKHGAYSSNKS